MKKLTTAAGAVRSVGGASQAIQQRHIDNCSKADPAYGAGVAAALRALKAGELG